MRGMKSGLARGAVFIGAALGVSGSAFGAAGFTYTTVEALATPVTYSRPDNKPPLTTYIGYRFRVQNVAGNTINNVSLTAIATVLDAREGIIFSSLDGQPCTTSPAAGVLTSSVTLTCPIGKLVAGASVDFNVFFVAPPKSIGVTSPNYVGIQGYVTTAEGADKGNSGNDSVDFFPIDNLATPTVVEPDDPATTLVQEKFDRCAGPALEFPTTTEHDCVKVSFGTPDGQRVRSAVQKSTGGTFFTGINAVPGYPFPDANGNLVPDPLTTSVTIPANQPNSTKALVAESTVELVDCTSARLVQCQVSQLDVLEAATGNTATFLPYLTIVLRMDSSNIKQGTKIGAVKLSYTGKTLDGTSVTNFPIPDCSNPTTPRTDGLPCIADKRWYNSVKRGEDTALKDDFEWKLISLKNGRFGID